MRFPCVVYLAEATKWLTQSDRLEWIAYRLTLKETALTWRIRNTSSPSYNTISYGTFSHRLRRINKMRYERRAKAIYVQPYTTILTNSIFLLCVTDVRNDQNGHSNRKLSLSANCFSFSISTAAWDIRHIYAKWPNIIQRIHFMANYCCNNIGRCCAQQLSIDGAVCVAYTISKRLHRKHTKHSYIFTLASVRGWSKAWKVVEKHTKWPTTATWPISIVHVLFAFMFSHIFPSFSFWLLLSVCVFVLCSSIEHLRCEQLARRFYNRCCRNG